MKKTGIIFFPAFDWAISPTHPEREERLLYTRDQIFEEGILDLPQLVEMKPRVAEPKDIARAHFCVPDVEDQATDAHLVAVGSALEIADGVMNGNIDNGFALVRPPGHHAKTVAHGNRGFCNINNEAIMIEYLRQKYGIKKVAIVDTDVHHGDGTQDIFYHDPDTLFISFHQDGRTLYPGTGHVNELGGPTAWGTTINIPMAPGTTDEGILYILDHLVKPLLEEFEPEIVINSAGQDNHYTDPLANMSFSAQGYARLNEKLAPDIAVLEGGYSVETALPYINMGIIMAMAGIDYSNLREPDYVADRFKENQRSMEYIRQLVDVQLAHFRMRERKQRELRQQYGSEYRYFERIFYDTDYIDEEQSVSLRICDGCNGYRTIDSTGHYRRGQSNRVFCIALPIDACEKCVQQAYQAYEDMKKSSAYDMVYLQDRSQDQYYRYITARDDERVL